MSEVRSVSLRLPLTLTRPPDTPGRVRSLTMAGSSGIEALAKRVVHAVQAATERRGKAERRQDVERHEGTGGIAVSYAPEHDGDADPGEVVWTWVPYEDDPEQGKDRPVLVLGHDGARLAGVQLSSKDHGGRRDEDDWVPVGTGAWDRQGRPSFADASRLLRFEASAVRREGSALSRDRFEAVIERVEQIHDWRH